MQGRDCSAELHVQRWRAGASVAWSVLILLPISFLLRTLAAVSILHPLSSLYEYAGDTFSRSSLPAVLIIAVTIATIAGLNVKFYAVKPVVLCRRIDLLWNAVKPENTLHMMGHGVAAALLAWCSAPRYRHTETDSTRFQLSERNAFLVIFSAFVGVACAAQFTVCQRNHLLFSVRQRKFVLVKSQLAGFVFSSFKYSLHKLKYFYLAYYLFIGQLLKGIVTNISNVHICDGDAVDSLSGLLDVSLMWRTLVAGAFIHLTYSLPRFLYIIYQTEPCEFPLDVSFTESPCLTLGDALNLPEQPLLQYLAFQDVSLLARHAGGRRRQAVFSLSPLGGHPHNWTAVSGACLRSLADFTRRLADVNGGVMARGSGGGQTGGAAAATRHAGSTSTPWRAATAPVSGPIRHRMADQSAAASLGNGCSPCTGIPGTEPLKKLESIGLLQKIFTQLHNTRAVAFFVAELPDAASHKVFADAQKQIWAIEALSYLVAASFTEDAYGVVQESLPAIIGCMLTLQEAVEKHFKLAFYISRKPSRGKQARSESTIRFSLKDALKSAIYRIVATFGDHLKSVTLSSEHSRRLQLFMDYKE